MKKIVRLNENDLIRLVKRVISESNWGDNPKNNPDTIFVKFTSEGYDKFYEDYLLFDYYRDTFAFYPSWEDLAKDYEPKGLKMMDGYFYLLCKVYEPEDLEKHKKSRKEGYPPATLYFITYDKKSGEINIYSLYADNSIQQRLKVNHSYKFEGNKLDARGLQHFIFKKDGEERVVDIGSTDQGGYFKVLDII